MFLATDTCEKSAGIHVIQSNGIHDLTGLKGYIEGLSKIGIPQMTIEDAPTKDNDKLYITPV